MPKKLLFLFIVAFCTQLINAQELYSENFESYAEGTGLSGIDGTPVGDFANLPFTIDATDTDWNDSANDYIQIDGTSDFELQMRDLDGEAVITFNPIDISSETGDVTINFSAVDFNIRSATSSWSEDADEYIDILYSLDDGDSFIRIPNHMGNGNDDHTFITPPTPTGTDRDGVDFDYSLSEIIDPGAATAIIIQIIANNNGANEEFEFDDLIISRNNIELYNEPFQSFGMPAQDFVTPSGFIGTGSNVNADTTTGTEPWTITADLQNSNDIAAVTGSSANGTNVFKFDDVNNDATFQTEAIDITGHAQVTFGFDINFDDTTYEDDDFVDVFYSTDGGTTFTLAQPDTDGVHTFTGDTSIAAIITSENRDVTFVETLNGLSATSLIIRITVNSDSGFEDYEIDNIAVEVGATLSTNNYEVGGLILYPNPVKDGILYIKSPLHAEIKTTLYDVTGREVYQTNVIDNKIELSHLKTGIYLLKIIKNNREITKRILL